MNEHIKLEATHLKENRYAVRPSGQLGTCGFYPYAWTVVYVNARSEADAIRKAKTASESNQKLRGGTFGF